MRELELLIGKKVFYELELDEEETIVVQGKVIDVEIETYYFFEKGESVQVKVNLSPLGEWSDDDCDDYYNEVPIEWIRLLK